MQSDSPFSDQLDTNYAATTVEIPEIETWISKQPAVMDSLDHELSELDQRRSELKERKRMHCESVKKHRGLISCTRRMPADILSAIFSDLLLIEGPEVSPYPVVTASHVCRFWRNIALGTPMLWTNLIINLPPYPYPFSNDAQMYTQVEGLSKEEREVYDNRVLLWQRLVSNTCDRLVAFGARSAQCPLLFSVRAHDEPLNKRLCTDPSYFQAAEDSFTGLVRAVNGTSSRWETVQIRLKVNSVMPMLLCLAKFAQFACASMRTLDYDLEYIGLTDVSKAWGKGVDILQSSLTSLTAQMTYSDICRIDATWSNITDLTLGLKDDVLNRHHEHALKVLQTMPNLRQLALEFAAQSVQINPQSPPPRVRLQYLECFTITGIPPPPGFAALLELPALTSLNFAHVRWHARGGSNAIVEWIRRYGQQLTHLSFDYTSFSGATPLWVLNNAPNVVSLEICCLRASNPGPEFVLDQEVGAEPRRISDQLIGMLTPLDESEEEFDHDCWCPKLERLSWTFGEGHGRRTREHFLKLIATRRSVPRDNSGTVSWLKEVEAVFPTGPIECMVEELQHRGVDLRGVKLSAMRGSGPPKPPIQIIPVPGLGGSVVIRGVPALAE